MFSAVESSTKSARETTLFQSQKSQKTTLELLQDAARELGLNSYQSQAYSNLLYHGPLSPSGLAEKSSVPRAKVYETLSQLALKGLASEVVTGECKQFKALELKKAVELHAHRELERLAGLRGAVLEIETRPKELFAEQFVELVACESHLKALQLMALEVAESKSEVLLSFKSFQASNELRKAIRKASASGVEVRALISARHGSLESLKEIEALGAKVKCVEDCQDFVLTEGHAFLKADSNGNTWVKITDGAGVENFRRLHYSQWDGARDSFKVEVQKPQAFADWEDKLTVQLWSN